MEPCSKPGRGAGSFQPKDEPSPDDPVQYRDQKRSKDTHQSTTDPEAKVFRKGKGKEAKLSYMGRLVLENSRGLSGNRCPVLHVRLAWQRANPGGG